MHKNEHINKKKNSKKSLDCLLFQTFHYNLLPDNNKGFQGLLKLENAYILITKRLTYRIFRQ